MVNSNLATLGGGCFWCLEAYFDLVKGVLNLTSGYSGGHLDNPTTNDVYSGKSGHAEVIQLEFDDKIISYEEILKIFFVMHDPTTLNRQGNDVGEHYRSVIFFHNEEQKNIAEKLHMTEGAISRQIERLRERGLITRTTKANNRREHEINCTSEGIKIRDEAIKTLSEKMSFISQALSKKEMSDFENAVEKLHECVVKYTNS